MANLFIDRGNLADAPELKHGTSKAGRPFTVANMRVFFGRYRQNSEGEVEQVGGFWRPVEIYDTKAEACARLLRKGARVLVVGQEREFMVRDDNGNEVPAYKIVADDVALQLTRIESITFAPSRYANANEDAAEPAAAAG